MPGKLIPIRDASVCREPTLVDMLADPIVKAVMRADGVDPEDIEALFRQMKPMPLRHGPLLRVRRRAWKPAAPDSRLLRKRGNIQPFNSAMAWAWMRLSPAATIRPPFLAGSPSQVVMTPPAPLTIGMRAATS